MKIYKRSFVLFALIGTRMSDLLTTYFVTPDLMKEKNSINTMLLNRNWFLIIIFQIFLIGSIIVFFMYFKRKSQFILVEKKEMSVYAFFSMQFFGDEHSFHKLLLHFPVQNKPLYYYLVAYFLVIGLISMSIILSLGNIIGPAGLNLFLFPPYWVYRLCYIGISLCVGFIMTKRHMQYLYKRCYASDQTA